MNGLQKIQMSCFIYGLVSDELWLDPFCVLRDLLENAILIRGVTTVGPQVLLTSVALLESQVAPSIFLRFAQSVDRSTNLLLLGASSAS